MLPCTYLDAEGTPNNDYHSLLRVIHHHIECWTKDLWPEIVAAINFLPETTLNCLVAYANYTDFMSQQLGTRYLERQGKANKSTTPRT